MRDEDDSTIKAFFRSFKSNFKQATAIWLLLLAAGLLLGFDFWFIVTGRMPVAGGIKLFFTAVFGGLLMILIFVGTYVFPLQCRFYNTVKRTLFNAFFMSVRHLFQTLGIIVIDIAILVLSYFSLFYLPPGVHAFDSLWHAANCFCQFFLLYRDFPQVYAERGGREDIIDISPLLDDNNER